MRLCGQAGELAGSCEACEGLAFELADAFARQVELATDFVEEYEAA
jgi:hypothetical protein